MIWPDPTHKPTPTKPYTHPWVGNSPQISNLQTESNYLDSFKCYGIFTVSRGTLPRGVVGGWIGVGMGMGMWGVPCMHACTCVHTHACCKHDKHGCLHGGGHLQFLYMYTCPYVHVHACVCMHVCVHMCEDTPNAPRHPPPTCHPEPQGAQNTKIQ